MLLCSSLGEDTRGFVSSLTFTMASKAQQNGEFCSGCFLAVAEFMWVHGADFSHVCDVQIGG